MSASVLSAARLIDATKLLGLACGALLVLGLAGCSESGSVGPTEPSAGQVVPVDTGTQEAGAPKVMMPGGKGPKVSN